MTFVDMILLNGRLHPNRPAIMLYERLVTYAMLADAIHWVAQRLHASGLKSGDTVVVCFDNPIRHLTVVAALMRLGIISMTAEPGQLPHLPDVGARALVTGSALAPPPGLRLVLVDDGWFQPPGTIDYSVDPAASDPGRLALLGLTSGTTGQSKVVAFTVGEFDLRLRNLMLYHGAPGTERDLILIGFSSQWALSEASRALACARTACFARSAEEALQMIDLFQVGAIFGSPQQFATLVAALDTTPASCASVRLVSVAGATLTPELGARIRQRICPVVMVGYGSTEAGKTAMGPLDRFEGVSGACGYVMPGVRIEIVDETGQPLPPGATGRVRILTPLGGRAFVPGTLYPDRTPDWFYPQDTGMLRDDGLLVVDGRTDELINAGGLKVAPERVEALVADRPDIADAAAFARPGPGGIDEIWLAVVARAPIRAEELLIWLTGRSPTLAPRRIVFVDAIPRNAMGKAERGKLRRAAAG
jgi:acyl-coenzyme A synthetase/AMP-(fatty) acid ligase